jgi:Fur family transcriptional regulator, ferric uptake regulator
MRLGLTQPASANGPAGDPPTATAREEAVRAFERFLASRDLRLTAARRAIAEAVLERAGHFPIEDLVRDLRRRGIRGSKATVYRTLPLLTEAGIIQQAVVTSEATSYEAAVGREHHDHLVCRGCGKVVEFEFDAIEILQREIASRFGFTLEGHHHQLFGRCAACRVGDSQ